MEPKERFTVMRVVLPVSQKAFCYAQAERMGLETPSEFVRRAVRDLMEAEEEFAEGRRAYEESKRSGGGSARRVGRAKGEGRGGRARRMKRAKGEGRARNT
ncbi:MAG: hypothetical protein IPJ77_18400 [Planctomycetes bacterium]|nr:hypothetical protein [Planctomycetota bacterium]